MPSGSPRFRFSTEPASRVGLFLACNGCSLSEATIPGSMGSGLTLQDLPACATARSALGSAAFAGLPQSQAVSSPRARCVSANRFAQLLPLPPLPSGTFTSLGIEAFSKFRCLAARLPNPPDFLSLPAAGSISRVGCGSTFLVRYVSGGSLFLKPLGTFFTMPLSPFSVNPFQSLENTISTTFICLYFESVTPNVRRISCG